MWNWVENIFTKFSFSHYGLKNEVLSCFIKFSLNIKISFKSKLFVCLAIYFQSMEKWLSKSLFQIVLYLPFYLLKKPQNYVFLVLFIVTLKYINCRFFWLQLIVVAGCYYYRQQTIRLKQSMDSIQLTI